jgi:pimeloyl-ACP methyl ester carboxylesterase/DNA-binding CsgD family transcriptional regulator
VASSSSGENGERPPAVSALERSADLLRSAWRGADPSGTADRKLLDELLDLAGSPSFARGAAALAPEEAVSVAVLGDREAVVAADLAFTDWFPDAATMPDLRRLAAKARRSGSALGLLQSADGAAMAAWAVCGPSALKWARSPAAHAALSRAGRVLVLVFAPSRSGDLTSRAAIAFGLTPLESRLAEAFLFAPTLEIAGAQAGVGRETARDAMERIMAKTGARRAADVVRRLTELMSAVHDHSVLTPEVLVEAFGLTRAEAGVALQLAVGATHREAAEALGLQLGTVRTYAKAALAKTGAGRAKDLGRLATEIQALSQLVSVAEPVFTSGAPSARLRIMPRPNGRRMAFLDYGPISARPAMIFHGFMAGRSLPPALAQGLQARGMRPIVLQRPGFGLTSPADGDYLACGTADRAALIEALGFEQVTLFARDGGTAAALAFASAYPGAIARAVLLNPRSPLGLPKAGQHGPVSRMARAILKQPQAIAGLGELIRQSTRSDFLEAGLRQMLRAHPGDKAALDDPAVRAQLVRDIQAQFAHSSAGYAAEHILYARGWRPLPVTGTGPWTVVSLGAFGQELARNPWLDLPQASFVSLADAGVLAQFTHADQLAALIAG